MNKNENEISRYEKYFGDDLIELEKEISRTDDLFKDIQDNINKIKHSESRGSYHYLIEHFKNIIAVQSQKQSMLKDKVSLKKVIMDYELKDNAGSNDSQMNEKLMELIELAKKQAQDTVKKNPSIQYPQNDEDLDALIDASLNEGED